MLAQVAIKHEKHGLITMHYHKHCNLMRKGGLIMKLKASPILIAAQGSEEDAKPHLVIPFEISLVPVLKSLFHRPPSMIDAKCEDE